MASSGERERACDERDKKRGNAEKALGNKGLRVEVSDNTKRLELKVIVCADYS